MHTIHLKQDIVREYIEAYNCFNICGMLYHLHRDIEFTSINRGKKSLCVKGIQAFQNLAELSKFFFSARQQTITGFIAAPNTTEVEIDYKGKLAINLPDGRRKNEIIELKARSVFIFNECKIISITNFS